MPHPSRTLTRRAGTLAALATVAACLAAWSWLRLEPGTATVRAAATPAVPKAAPAPDATAPATIDALPAYRNWDTYTVADGLPSNKVFTVRLDGPRVWAGTDKGLARFQDGRWTVFGVREGLPHPVVLSLDVSALTGDVWIGTMGGLARYSGGRIDAFTQLTSGLSNDFVNDVECDREQPHIWAATAMGLCRLDLTTGRWSVFTEENTPMHEPWTYSLAAGPKVVWLGAWGAGVLEYDRATGTWRPFRDPDKEMEIDLLPDDGPVHDVTSGVDFKEGVLWQSSYFGLARYDGRRWRSYFREDSGLASNFINFVRARGRIAWLATDNGLSATDGEHWVTYRRTPAGRGELLQFAGGPEPSARHALPSGPAHNYMLSVDFQGDDLWVATEGGVSHAHASPNTLTRGRPANRDRTN